jgi:hypothetical protein
VLATEISTHSNELDLSFHVTCYAPQYSEAIATRIRRVIDGKKEKVQKQIQKLQQKGFHISTSDFFSWIEGQRMSPESASNWHLAYFIWKNKENRDLANDYTHGKIPRNTSEESQVIFMKECLRENGDYRNIGYVRVPQYEPELSELITIAKKEDLTLCIAHPNFSFTKKLQKEHGALHQKDQALAFEKYIVSKLSDI